MIDTGAWPASVAAARAVQERLAAKVTCRGTAEGARTVAGVDVHVKGETAIGVAALVSLPGLDLLETSVARRRVRFPYVPGYLAFREAPAALAAVRSLERRPDALLVDGHGLAHPRGFGLACHLGVELDLPTVGCAKSPLVGEYREPGQSRGSTAPLLDGPTQLGTVLRTRDRVRPVFVSVGHRLSLEEAVDLVVRCTGRYRLPEPARQAHLAARALASA